MEQEIKRKIEEHSWFRERQNKNLGIAMFLKKRYNLDIEIYTLQAVIEDANSADRYWRKILLENENLRGQDYNTKRLVVQRKQMELGYEAGANVKLKI